MSNELEQFSPTPMVLMAGGRSVEITPIRVRELAAFTRAVQPLVRAVGSGGDIAALLAEHADAVIEATAVGARLERGFVEGLALDELYDLADAVLAVNLDFFMRGLLPRIGKSSSRLTAAMAGLPSMPASVPPGSAA